MTQSLVTVDRGYRKQQTRKNSVSQRVAHTGFISLLTSNLLDCNTFFNGSARYLRMNKYCQLVLVLSAPLKIIRIHYPAHSA